VPGSPGADDNGSALAVLLELARILADTPARRTILLVASDLEDDQAGSYAYAKHVKRSGEPLSLMISPAIMITDTANMRNSHYYRVSDHIDTLDLAFLAGVCRGLIAGPSTL
jgi:Zn-dependent M28 family amino/carboxypeptidase